MATKKFSEFDSVPTPVLADIELVGLDDAGQNARFPGSAFDGAAWGNITGTLADQTDLNSALNGKVETLNPVFGGDIDVAEFTLNNVAMLAATGTPADGITLRVDNSADYDFSYIADAGLTVATIKSGGLSGAWFDSNMTASAAFPAFRFVHSQTQSGSASIASFGHAGLVDAFTISRTGDVAAAGTVTGQFVRGTSNITADNLAGIGERNVVADEDGVLLSVGWDWITATSTAQTTDAATPQLLVLSTPADGARESWELLVTGNRQTTAGTVFASLIFTVTRVGATCVVSSSPEIKKVTTGTGNTTTIDVGVYGTSFLAAVYGNASETWDWKAQYRHRTIS